METLVSDWTIAIEALDADSVKSLYKAHPHLLWTPLQLSSHLESDFAPFIQRLKQVETLGTSLRPLFAFQHVLLDFGTAGDEWVADRLALVEFFLQNSTAEQLNTCVWGSAQNTVLHLAYFINHSNLIEQLLSKGALPKINALGFLPSQIKEQVKLMFSKRENKPTKVVAADRFKQLKQFAESSSTLLSSSNTLQQQQQQQQQQHQQQHGQQHQLQQQQQSSLSLMQRHKSTRRYFRPGHIEERKRKVLSEEEQEQEKKRLDRQKEVELLAQRSAVKNNPLYKILEDKVDDEQRHRNNEDNSNTNDNAKPQLQQSQQSLSSSSVTDRRASRVITSLKDNSYVSNSIFRQQKQTIDETDNLQVPSLEQLRAAAAAITREKDEALLEKQTTSMASDTEQESLSTPATTAEAEAETVCEMTSNDDDQQQQKIETIIENIDEEEEDEEFQEEVEMVVDHKVMDSSISKKRSLDDNIEEKEQKQEEEKNEKVTNIKPIPTSATVIENVLNEEVEEVEENHQSIKDKTEDNLVSSSTMSCTTQNENDYNQVDADTTTTTTTNNDDNVGMLVDHAHSIQTAAPAAAVNDDTPLLPNNNDKTNTTMTITTTMITPIPIMDSDKKKWLHNETPLEVETQEEESIITHEDSHITSLQNTPTDTLYETDEAITPINNNNLIIKDDYFSELTQTTTTPPAEYDNEWQSNYYQQQKQVTTIINENEPLQVIAPTPEYIYNHHDIVVEEEAEEEEVDLQQKDETLLYGGNLIFSSNDDDDNDDGMGILEFRGLSSEILRTKTTTRDSMMSEEEIEWYNNYKRSSSNKAESTIRSSVSESSCKQSNSTENTSYMDDDEQFDDYYSTKLHTEINQKQSNDFNTVGIKDENLSSIVKSQHQHDDQEDEEEQEEDGVGEITVYLDRSSLQDDYMNQQKENEDDLQNALDVRNLSNLDFNHSNITLNSTISSLSTSPQDPSQPRIEDISYYLTTLPVFEKAAALLQEEDEEEENRPSKRACEQDHELLEARAIPSAHEIYYGSSPIPSTFAIPSSLSPPNITSTDSKNTDSSLLQPPHFTLDNSLSEQQLEHEEEEEEEDTVPSIKKRGKLYVGIRGANNMLLPIPHELTYVRCVISDGKYEYMSRYEILGPQILIDYECQMDVVPGTIVTVSLQVRPDYHVMPRTGLISKWFTSARRQKEQLSGYVHPTDGTISQTRFSVDAMIPKCYKRTYQSSHFDCFNSWYTRTSQERAREQHCEEEDMLKIVGKLTVEMLYLPILDDETMVPKSLRECDLTLKIKQWHATCWRSGYLSIKSEESNRFERHFYRLIGSQLVGYNEDKSQVYACYNISKVLRLEGDPIFFRLVFDDHFVECQSETRSWFKTIRSMIGRVPLDTSF